jgi:hypothetical protein
MTTACLAQSQSYELPAHRGVFARVPFLVWNIIAVAAIAILGIAYLAEVNKTLSASYEMREAQKRVDAGGTAMRANEIKLSEYSTIDNLTTQAAAIGMIPTSAVEYMNVSRTGVAMR